MFADGAEKNRGVSYMVCGAELIRRLATSAPQRKAYRLLFVTDGARSLNQQVYFLPLVTGRQADGGNLNVIQTGGLPTPFTFEMNMIVVMVVFPAGWSAERIFSAAFIIEHFMNEPFIQKRF